LHFFAGLPAASRLQDRTDKQARFPSENDPGTFDASR
jgi:hypothetical protein